MWSNASISEFQKNDRGVALIIVLLVTALLIALVFEFAYGTRISLRAAVNFRNRERAYYLARSGVNLLGLLLSDDARNNKPQADLQMPEPGYDLTNMLGMNDASGRVVWSDESGKINITNVTRGNSTYRLLTNLFFNKGIDQSVLDQIVDWQQSESRKFYLLTELHQFKFISDEIFNKIKDDVTLAPVTNIDINTASPDVLKSVLLDEAKVTEIIRNRTNNPYTAVPSGYATNAATLDVTSNVFKVDSYATVGGAEGVDGYTKHIEAIIQRNTSGFYVLYWRAL